MLLQQKNQIKWSVYTRRGFKKTEQKLEFSVRYLTAKHNGYDVIKYVNIFAVLTQSSVTTDRISLVHTGESF